MTPMTLEQKRSFNKLKHELEPWRNLLAQLDSVLKWEKPYYPAVIFGAITFFYLVLWELNLSTITLLALAGLTIMAFDFGYPLLARMLYKQSNWSGAQEESYEHICMQICAIKMTCSSWFEYWFDNKERKSTVIVVMVGVLLLLLAWVGAAFDNMFLMYCVTVTMALLPGIMQKSVVENFREKLFVLVKNQTQQLRQRSQSVKAD